MLHWNVSASAEHGRGFSIRKTTLHVAPSRDARAKLLFRGPILDWASQGRERHKVQDRMPFRSSDVRIGPVTSLRSGHSRAPSFSAATKCSLGGMEGRS